jgi:phosphoglycolate phosphatase
MKPITLIFDLDDTIIESFPGYVSLHQRVARDLGWRVPDEDELIHYGPTWEATVARMWPNVDLTSFFHRFEQILESVVYGAIDGALEALEKLRDRGHRQFIVTKRSSRRLSLRLSQAGVETHWFDGIFPADHGPAPKPDPRCFDPVWEKIGSLRIPKEFQANFRLLAAHTKFTYRILIRV